MPVPWNLNTVIFEYRNTLFSGLVHTNLFLLWMTLLLIHQFALFPRYLHKLLFRLLLVLNIFLKFFIAESLATTNSP